MHDCATGSFFLVFWHDDPHFRNTVVKDGHVRNAESFSQFFIRTQTITTLYVHSQLLIRTERQTSLCDSDAWQRINENVAIKRYSSRCDFSLPPQPHVWSQTRVYLISTNNLAFQPMVQINLSLEKAQLN